MCNGDSTCGPCGIAKASKLQKEFKSTPEEPEMEKASEPIYGSDEDVVHEYLETNPNNYNKFPGPEDYDKHEGKVQFSYGTGDKVAPQFNTEDYQPPQEPVPMMRNTHKSVSQVSSLHKAFFGGSGIMKRMPDWQHNLREAGKLSAWAEHPADKPNQKPRSKEQRAAAHREAEPLYSMAETERVHRKQEGKKDKAPSPHPKFSGAGSFKPSDFSRRKQLEQLAKAVSMRKAEEEKLMATESNEDWRDTTVINSPRPLAAKKWNGQVVSDASSEAKRVEELRKSLQVSKEYKAEGPKKCPTCHKHISYCSC